MGKIGIIPSHLKNNIPMTYLFPTPMWSFYARDGMAIKTTLGRIQTAIGETELEELLVARMEYPIQGRLHPLFRDPDFARRPFLFKSASYDHEAEVRLVFRVNPAAVESGIKINVDAKRLLDGGEIIISPFMLADEARAVKEVARSLMPEVSVGIRHSSESSETSSDPTNALSWGDELIRCFKPFSREEDLPDLLGEL